MPSSDSNEIPNPVEEVDHTEDKSLIEQVSQAALVADLDVASTELPPLRESLSEREEGMAWTLNYL